MSASLSPVPGVRREELPALVPPGLRTGVPAFIGFAAEGPPAQPVELVRRADYAPRFGRPVPGGYLAACVDAFFGNGGERCVVVGLRLADAAALDDRPALRTGLDAVRPLETVDLVCIPDLMRGAAALLARRAAGAQVTDGEREAARDASLGMQEEVLEHCDRLGDRMALLDSLPDATPDLVREQRARLAGTNGALYYPWLRAEGGAPGTPALVPPCGHVAGVYARSDARAGVHRAPANERLEGVVDVETPLDDARQGELNPVGVNCIRAFPGRGVRVWGARTLSADPAWRYVSVRRVFLTLARWVALNLPGAAFEPSTPLLWARIGREVGAYLHEQHRRGALRGRTPGQAFYVRCDAAVNPPEVRQAGMVVTEVGLAPLAPNEFVVVRLTHGRGGVELAGATPAA